MKLLTKSIITIIIANMMLFAQQKDYSGEKGYLDFGNLDELEAGNRVVDVFLEGNLLRLVSKFAETEDPELAEVIKGLKLIKAKVLEVTDENEKKLQERMADTEKTLKKNKWDMLVRIRDVDENVNVYLKSTSPDRIEGLVVTALDGKDATFVNIVGDINLETIGKLSRKFDIPALEKINGGKR